MKAKAIILWMFAILVLIVGGVWEWYIGYQASQTLAYLKLADDASDPQVKADYLKEFLSKVKDKNLPPYAAFVFPTERISVKQQDAIILSLVKRCEETAKLPRESFGFAQGMTQITGQEFDHTLNEVSSIYEKALQMRYGFILYYGLAWAFILSVLIGIKALIVSDKVWRIF